MDDLAPTNYSPGRRGPRVGDNGATGNLTSDHAVSLVIVVSSASSYFGARSACVVKRPHNNSPATDLSQADNIKRVLDQPPLLLLLQHIYHLLQ